MPNVRIRVLSRASTFCVKNVLSYSLSMQEMKNDKLIEILSEKTPFEISGLSENNKRIKYKLIYRTVQCQATPSHCNLGSII